MLCKDLQIHFLTHVNFTLHKDLSKDPFNLVKYDGGL